MTDKYFNRELSWLSFNYRVLQEAKDLSVPLFERIKFLAIFSSNLDEFYRVRVASLRSLLGLKKKSQKKLKLNPQALLDKIQKTVHEHQEEFGEIFRNQIIPDMKQHGIYLVKEYELNSDQKEFASEFFNENILPLVQPSLLEKKKISLFLKNKAIYLAARLNYPNKGKEKRKNKKSKYAILEIPTEKLSRFIELPEKNGKKYVMFLDDIIRFNLPKLFSGYEVTEAYSVKLTRDAELYIDDEFSGNLLEKIKKSLSKRRTGVPCRFLYDSFMPEDFLSYLKDALNLNNDDLFPGGRYHNFNDFFSFPKNGFGKLEYSPMPPLPSAQLENEKSILDYIESREVLLHYPYQKFDYVIRLLNEAAEDANVNSIKLTLYRTAENSNVIAALIKAAKNGKKVFAFVEVKARFDEELNFQNGEEMEKAGIKVLYSFPGLKVHSKICLIERKEENEKKYYAYLATGNFNEKTAFVYSDLGLMTSDEKITKEVKKVFNFLQKESEEEEFSTLLVSPFNLRSRLNEMIDTEIKNASKGLKAEIILKLNSIEDKKIIKKLYNASQAGVKVTMIVRGICVLVPGKKGLSENIKITSIVDRFLEHSRIYVFHNGGDEKIFLSSADWMRRNLNRRVEVCFPIFDDGIKAFLRKLIDIQLKDNLKARRINQMQSNPYKRTRSAKKIRAQYEIYRILNEMNSQKQTSSKAV